MLKNLFSPITIKGKTLKNRMAVAPMVTNYCNEDGTCTEMFSAYHEAKAKGGFGMIITEDFAVRPREKGSSICPDCGTMSRSQDLRNLRKGSTSMILF